MELRQLKAFVKAAELLNFTEAAKTVFVTQSSFSQSIRQLEEELDVKLFHRNSHEVTLTQAGVELLPYAILTIQKAEDCKSRIVDLKNMRIGTLNVGVTYSFSALMVETMENFMRKYPGIKLNVFHHTMENLMEMIEKRDIDFALSFKPSETYPNIESHLLFDDRLSVVVKSSHPCAGKKSITIEEIAKYPLALPAKGLQARFSFEKVVEKYLVKLDVRTEIDNVVTLLRLVRNTDLVTMLPKASVDTFPDLVTIPIDDEDSVMTGSVSVLKESYKKASAKEFVRMLCETNDIKVKMSSWF